jgi:Fe-S oxidoreductase
LPAEDSRFWAKGERVSHNRAKELVATGADVVAAACPFCSTMFRDALPAVSANPPKLLDIAQIIATSLPSEPLWERRAGPVSGPVAGPENTRR